MSSQLIYSKVWFQVTTVTSLFYAVSLQYALYCNILTIKHYLIDPYSRVTLIKIHKKRDLESTQMTLTSYCDQQLHL